jgi:hypothetical protein
MFANFSWTNPNSVTVTVPPTDSKIIGTSGTWDASKIPPNSFPVPPGTGKYKVGFTGAKISWSITSFNGAQGHSTSATSDASSTSNGNCPGTLTTQRASDVQGVNEFD